MGAFKCVYTIPKTAPVPQKDFDTGAVLVSLMQKATWLRVGASTKTVMKIGTCAVPEILLVYNRSGTEPTLEQCHGIMDYCRSNTALSVGWVPHWLYLYFFSLNVE